MAAVYLFSEALSTQQICAIHRMGAGYKVIPSVFKFLFVKILEILSEWFIYIKRISVKSFD